jgi:hypothetical protein
MKGIKRVHGKAQRKVSEHPFFNMLWRSEPVDRQMNRLRGGRYRDL